MLQIIQRYDYHKDKYVPYEVPDWVTLSFFDNEVKGPINCANCFTPMLYGEAYTSLEIHTPNGFGYCICKDCHEEEINKRKEEIKMNSNYISNCDEKNSQNELCATPSDPGIIMVLAQNREDLMEIQEKIKGLQTIIGGFGKGMEMDIKSSPGSLMEELHLQRSLIILIKENLGFINKKFTD